MENRKTNSICKGSCPILRENWENKENKGFLGDLCVMLPPVFKENKEIRENQQYVYSVRCAQIIYLLSSQGFRVLFCH